MANAMFAPSALHTSHDCTFLLSRHCGWILSVSVSGKEWIDWISYYFVPVLMWMWMMMMVMTAVLGWMEQNKIQQWTESNCVGGECRG